MIVVEFEGVRHYGKPGWSERPVRVREDYGEWRPVNSQDGKRIAAWLVKHGYRVLNTVGRSHNGSSYREWWGLVSVFPMETDDLGLPVGIAPEVIRETFQAFRSQVEAVAEKPTPIQLPNRPSLSRQLAEYSDMTPREAFEELKARQEYGY